ncbi:MAG: hypothetical protein J6T67_07890 [Paludibacteraceae bacterium]|nr:hypothetical protein [Paludibacteraceae bacterium]
MDGFDLFAYEQNYRDGQCVLREDRSTIVLFETDDAYGKQVIPDAPEMVCTQYMYDPESLDLTSEGQFLKDHYIQIGLWKQYDAYGEVVEEQDMDKGFPVKWAELKGILLANGNRLEDIQQLSRFYGEDKRPVWLAVMKTVQGVRETLLVDAVSGEVIQHESKRLK